MTSQSPATEPSNSALPSEYPNINPSLLSILQSLFGKNLKNYISCCSSISTKYIRFNISKIKRLFPQYQAMSSEELSSLYYNYLKGEQIFLAKTSISSIAPVYKVTTSHYPIGATPDYLKGLYYISDLASNIPVVSLSPQPGDKVLDMCAAPGGKTCHIGDLLNNKGFLVANDFSKNEGRFNALQANLNRCSVKNVVVTNLDGKDIIKYMKAFDKVLLDAPCSGTGVFGKDANVALKRDIEQIRDRARQQKELLLAAIDACKKGGIIVYSTCSIAIEENEEVIDYVLRKRKIKVKEVFEKEKFDFGVDGIGRNKNNIFDANVKKCRRFYPHIHNTIGFFVAKIEKME
eukprot:GAHX01001677.1.p1 GENE.GAHX01001677.1~~GAHX01001677.1.p1  ORF type:complete len:347 (+),score=77.77 GAHX01001677.1:48-1088(+)